MPTPAPYSISATTGTVTTSATVSGRSVAFGYVQVYDGSTLVGSDVADSAGNWAAILAVLTLGNHTLTANVQDPSSGFWSAASSSFVVTIKPDAPAITSIPTPGPATPTAPVTVNGTGVAGYTVKLYDGSYFVGSTVVGAGGTWTLVVNFYPGTHSLSATQTSTPVGGSTFTSAASPSASVTVYAPPAAPWSILASDATVLTFGTVAGSSVAGGTVELYDGSTLLATTTTNAGGDWSTLLPLLTLGNHTLRARVQDPASGFWSSLSSSFVVTVNPERVVVTSVSPLGPASPTARVNGTGTAGYTVKIYDGSTFLGAGVIAADGTWSVDVNVAAGTRALNATQTSPTGFTSDASTPVQLVVPDALAVNPAPVNVFTATTVAIGGQGIAGATLELFDGGVEVGTVVVGPSGTWTASLSFVTAGVHTLTARQQDPGTGYWSPSATFTIAAFVDPGPPAISRARR
jgi:hypothetical protein